MKIAYPRDYNPRPAFIQITERDLNFIKAKKNF